LEKEVWLARESHHLGLVFFKFLGVAWWVFKSANGSLVVLS